MKTAEGMEVSGVLGRVIMGVVEERVCELVDGPGWNEGISGMTGTGGRARVGGGCGGVSVDVEV